MFAQKENRSNNQEGIAMVTTLMLTLLLSILVGAMLMSSTADVLIGGNEVRTNQTFYIAEAGIHRAASWFSARFGADPSSSRYLLPEQYASNTAGVIGKLSYTDLPVFQKGASIISLEQSTPTSVKVLAGNLLQNVILAGDSTNTYPTSYSITANDLTGNPITKTYAGVVTDFAANLYDQVINQPASEGKFSVKATLVSIVPPSPDEPNGNIVWLIESTGRIVGSGDVTMASATISAYLTSPATAMTQTNWNTKNITQVNVYSSLVARGNIRLNAHPNRVDSYKSSFGAYGISLRAASYAGQIGSRNIGSRGDLRTNNDTINGQVTYIDASGGTITGKAYAQLPAPLPGDLFDPINIDMSKVSDGRGGNFLPSNKIYGQAMLNFPEPPAPTPPAANAPNYTYSNNAAGTLPAGNFNNVTISKGTFTLPPGNYGDITLSGGTIVLGVPGQSTIYSFRNFNAGSNTQIMYRGPVTINVLNNLDVGAHSRVSDLSIQANAIRWNLVGAGTTQQVSIGGTGDTLGVFYCPNNDLLVKATGDFFGAIVARNVELRGTGDVHIDEDAFISVTNTQTVPEPITINIGYTGSNYRLRRIMQTIN